MLANLIVPLLAGLLYSAVGKAYLQDVRIIFLGCAICFFSAAILEAFIKIPQIALPPISNPLHTIKRDLGESLYFLTSKQICHTPVLLRKSWVRGLDLSPSSPWGRVILELPLACGVPHPRKKWRSCTRNILQVSVKGRRSHNYTVQIDRISLQVSRKACPHKEVF